MQDGGVVGVGVTDLDRRSAVALQLDPVDGNGSVVDGAWRNLAGKSTSHSSGAADGALLVHHRDRAVVA
jgi:hypothetical protein